MSSFIMDLFSLILGTLILTMVFVVIPLFFIISLVLFIVATIQNKKMPGRHSKERMNLLLSLVIVSTVILLLTITALILMAVWISQAIVYM